MTVTVGVFVNQMEFVGQADVAMAFLNSDRMTLAWTIATDLLEDLEKRGIHPSDQLCSEFIRARAQMETIVKYWS